ncbi:F-box only protein 32-like [Styela clava]
MAVSLWGGAGLRWIKGPGGWQEDVTQSEVIVDSIHINQVKKTIEMFLRSKQQKAYKRLYSYLSAAPVSKCSAKESVTWLQISSEGSKECHGYSTLGELLRRLHLSGSVWQQGRFKYVICLTELIVKKKLSTLSVTSRKHLFILVETLIQRVIETSERIRQMKRIVAVVFRSLMEKNYFVGSKLAWFAEVEKVRDWTSRLNQLTISPRIDLQLSIPDLPVCVQRNIIRMLDDHEDIESLSHVNKTLNHLCKESDVWRSICFNHFSKNQLEECEAVLERRRLKGSLSGNDVELTWRIKYHFMLKRFEIQETFADPLLLCKRCYTVFWRESGHPCVGNVSETTYMPIHPKQLISLL